MEMLHPTVQALTHAVDAFVGKSLHRPQEDQVHNLKWLAGRLSAANLDSLLHAVQSARRNNRKDGE